MGVAGAVGAGVADLGPRPSAPLPPQPRLLQRRGASQPAGPALPPAPSPPQAPNKALASILGKSNLRFAGMSIAVSISTDGLNLSVPATRQVGVAGCRAALASGGGWRGAGCRAAGGCGHLGCAENPPGARS